MKKFYCIKTTKEQTIIIAYTETSSGYKEECYPQKSFLNVDKMITHQIKISPFQKA